MQVCAYHHEDRAAMTRRLDSIDDRLSGHDRRFDHLDSQLTKVREATERIAARSDTEAVTVRVHGLSPSATRILRLILAGLGVLGILGAGGAALWGCL